MSSKAPATQEQSSSTALTVRKGANLPEEKWPEERVAAAIRLLPARFQDKVNAIAYLARAHRSGLDPFMNELWAWEHKGDLQFMVGRDGWLKLARQDDNILGLEFQHVYEGETFQWVKQGGEITVEHSGGMKKGDLIGAYCVAHVREGDDHMEMRTVEDYSHLQGKQVWRDYGTDMLLTRVISACVRLVSPAGSGLYSKADFELGEAEERAEVPGAGVDAQADALAAELETEEAVEVESTEADDQEPEEGAVQEATEAAMDDGDLSPSEEQAMAEMDAGGLAAGIDEMSDEEAGIEEEGGVDEEPEQPELKTCRICGEEMEPKQLGGHTGGHSRKDETIPDGYRVEKIGANQYELIDPNGEVHGVGKNDKPFSDYPFALKAAHRMHRVRTGEDVEQEVEPEEPAEEPAGKDEPQPSTQSTETASTSSDEDVDPEEEMDRWGQVYKDIYALIGEHGKDIEFVRKHAEKLFPSSVDEGGVPKMKALSASQLTALREELKEVLGVED